MMRFMFFAFISVPALAADIYFDLASAGANNGTNCANARAYSSHSIGDDVAGNTLHICGTGTATGGSTALTTLAAGSAGAPITIKFEAGAILQADYWDGINGAIHLAHSYWTIDGGTNGIVQNTLNGSTGATCPGGPCTQNQVSRGIFGDQNADHSIVQNLTIQNLFVRVANTATAEGGGGADTTAVTLYGNNSRITQNTITMTVIGAGLLYYAANSAHLEIDHNTFSACNHCIGGGTAGTSINMDDIVIHDNDFAGNAAMWDNTATEYHRNGIQIIADSGSCTSCTITNLQIYNNIFRGSWSTWQSGGPNQLTSSIFLDDQGGNTIAGWKIYNNIFAMSANDGGGVACAYGPCQAQTGTTESGNVLANNTFYQSAGGGTCIRLDRQLTLTMENNIIDGCGYAFNNAIAPLSGTIDYNLWYNTAGSPGSGWIWQSGGCGTGTGCNFSTWQASFDSHGMNASNPNLTAAYKLNTGSPAISSGANLTSLGITALNSGAPDTFGVGGTCGSGCVARPSSGAWDIGAYQYVPPPTGITRSNVTTSGPMVSK